MFKSLAVATLLCATSLFTFAQAPSGGGATVRYQTYNSTAELVMRVADQLFCEKYNLKCTPVFIPSSPQGLQAMLGNSLDVTFLGTDFGVRAASNGAKIKIVSNASEKANYQLVVRKDEEWPNRKAGYPTVMKDFEGRKVGVSGRGASTELMFRLLMRDADLDINKVTLVGVGGPTTALGALRAKQVDAVILFQPLSAICDLSDVCETLMDLMKPGRPKVLAQYDGAFTTIWAAAAALQRRPNVFEAYTAALHDAKEWMVDPANFGKVMQIAKGYIKIDLPNADKILEVGVREAVSNTKTSLRVNAVAAFVKLLQDNAMLGPTPVSTKDLVWEHARLQKD